MGRSPLCRGEGKDFSSILGSPRLLQRREAGQENVGTGHSAVRSVQMEIHPYIVVNYVRQLKVDGSVKPIDVTELPDGTRTRSRWGISLNLWRGLVSS